MREWNRYQTSCNSPTTALIPQTSESKTLICPFLRTPVTSEVPSDNEVVSFVVGFCLCGLVLLVVVVVVVLISQHQINTWFVGGGEGRGEEEG